MATIIKDSFTHRIQSAHVDWMEYLINVHLPPTYGMNKDSYPAIYYPDAFVGTEITTGTKKILELSGKIINTILVGISQEAGSMRWMSDRCRDLTPTHMPQDQIIVYPGIKTRPAHRSIFGIAFNLHFKGVALPIQIGTDYSAKR